MDVHANSQCLLCKVRIHIEGNVLVSGVFFHLFALLLPLLESVASSKREERNA